MRLKLAPGLPMEDVRRRGGGSRNADEITSSDTDSVSIINTAALIDKKQATSPTLLLSPVPVLFLCLRTRDCRFSVVPVDGGRQSHTEKQRSWSPWLCEQGGREGMEQNRKSTLFSNFLTKIPDFPRLFFFRTSSRIERKMLLYA